MESLLTPLEVRERFPAHHPLQRLVAMIGHLCEHPAVFGLWIVDPSAVGLDNSHATEFEIRIVGATALMTQLDHSILDMCAHAAVQHGLRLQAIYRAIGHGNSVACWIVAWRGL